MLPTADTAGSFTAQSVTSMLRSSGRFPDATVEELTTSPIGAGQMAASYRLELSYATAVPDAPGERGRQGVQFRRGKSVDGGRHGRLSPGGAVLSATGQPRADPDPECYTPTSRDDVSFVALLEDLGPARTLEQIGLAVPRTGRGMALARGAAVVVAARTTFGRMAAGGVGSGARSERPSPRSQTVARTDSVILRPRARLGGKPVGRRGRYMVQDAAQPSHVVAR